MSIQAPTHRHSRCIQAGRRRLGGSRDAFLVCDHVDLARDRGAPGGRVAEW
jgi:hypothetical protein